MELTWVETCIKPAFHSLRGIRRLSLETEVGFHPALSSCCFSLSPLSFFCSPIPLSLISLYPFFLCPVSYIPTSPSASFFSLCSPPGYYPHDQFVHNFFKRILLFWQFKHSGDIFLKLFKLVYANHSSQTCLKM